MREHQPPRIRSAAPSWRVLLALLLLVAVALAGAGALGSTAAGYTDRVHARSGSIAAAPSPAFRPGLGDIRTIDTGFGLGNDGRVRVWGNVSLGIAGGLAWGLQAWPTPVPNLPEMRQLTASASGANSLDASGQVWGWGSNRFVDGTDGFRLGANAARLRIGTSWNGAGPHLDGILTIASTAFAGAGIRADGTVWHWGDTENSGGNVGAGASQLLGLPEPSQPGNRPVYLNGGSTNFFLILENGEVYTWGGLLWNGANSLPSGLGNTQAVPTRITSLSPWARHNVGAGQPYIVAVDGGLGIGGALLSDGRLLSWGSGADRIGGRSTSPVPANAPGIVPGVSGIRSFQYGSNGALLLRGDSELWAYGGNGNPMALPQTAARIDTGVRQISMAQGFGIWERDDGTFWARGQNGAGQIGQPAFNQTTNTRVSWDLTPMAAQ